jgi:hypothetical protein
MSLGFDRTVISYNVTFQNHVYVWLGVGSTQFPFTPMPLRGMGFVYKSFAALELTRQERHRLGVVCRLSCLLSPLGVLFSWSCWMTSGCLCLRFGRPAFHATDERDGRTRKCEYGYAVRIVSTLTAHG